MTDMIVVPGLGGSGLDHWQSRWEKNHPNMARIQPRSWDAPDLEDWVIALELAVSKADTPPILVAHSLGCLLVAIWQKTSALPVLGAFLVAVPDPQTQGFDLLAPSFANVPCDRLRFPSLIISSTSDPYDQRGYAFNKAQQWDSEYLSVGDCGHINDESGLGEWETGHQFLSSFVEKLKPIAA
jgi:predicted alpha/beta hydrolase family esterase